MPENVAESSAPKRPRGRPSKVRASGPLAGVVLIPPGPGAEDPQEFAEFALPLRAVLAPQGPLEALLAERIIGNAWRLRRVLRFEAAQVQEHTAQAEHFRKLTDNAQRGSPELARATEQVLHALKAVPHEHDLKRILRYEAFLEHSLLRALHELERLQGLRSRGARPPAPGTADPEFPFPSENREPSQISSEK
ncbi:MAG TPA: hypothetical protein VL359_14565 [bacterium]|nr:hypothetical protein [bacterium]